MAISERNPNNKDLLKFARENKEKITDLVEQEAADTEAGIFSVVESAHNWTIDAKTDQTWFCKKNFWISTTKQ